MNNTSTITIKGHNINNECKNIIDVLLKTDIKFKILKDDTLNNACTFEFNSKDKNKIKNKIWIPLKTNLKISSCELIIPNLFNGNIDKYLENELRPIYYK